MNEVNKTIMVHHQENENQLKSLSLKSRNKCENYQQQQQQQLPPLSLPSPISGTRAPMTSPKSQPSSPRPLNCSSPFTNTTMLSNLGTNISSSGSNCISPGDSRIPRPSLTALRRSTSMRLRGERVSDHIRITGSPGFNSLQHHHHQNHNRHGGHIIQQQTEIFPAITENGLDSPRHRSLSLSLTPARPRLGHAARTSNNESNLIDDSDVDSVKSYGSACSTASACDHAHFALNGTTWSGRSRKYVVHCSNHNDDSEQYLTPTQRATRQIRKFQSLLNDANKAIDAKDKEILRLTKELVELRLYKASLNSPDEKTDSSDALTVRENNQFSPESPCKDLPQENYINSPDSPDEKRATVVSEVSELPLSLADSGHFEDESIYSKESTAGTSLVDGPATRTKNSGDDNIQNESNIPVNLPDDARRKIVDHYESRIDEMHRRHVDELQKIKEKHNDKVESLLNQLSEVNTRYCELRPSMDAADAKVRELEAELDCTKVQLAEQKTLFDEQEERNKQMYLKMYAKGQEAARLEQADQIFDQTRDKPTKVTISEVLQELSVTQAELENVKGTSYLPQLHISADRSQSLLSAQEAVSLWVLATRKAMYRSIVQSRNKGAIDPEITLQFLKSAVYYFLIDKENHHGHLSAIESILGFTDNEKLNIDKIYGSTRK